MANTEVLTSEEIDKLPVHTISSEFDKLQDMKKQSDAQLYAMGMSKEDVLKFKSTSVKNLVLENANETLTDNRMLEKGLSKNTIQNIREGNYDAISESDAEKASAELHLGLGNWAHSGTSANCSIYWWWADKPLNRWTDTIASYITNGFDVTASSTCLVKYAELNSMTPDADKRYGLSYAESSHVARFDFPVIQFSTKWAQAGKAFVSHIGQNMSGVPIQFTGNYYHQWYPIDIFIDLWGVIHFDPKEGKLYTVQDTFY